MARLARKTGRIADRGNSQHSYDGANVTFVAAGVRQPGAGEMQVFCKKMNGHAETHCCVCGQGFVMFWERQSRPERVEALREMQKFLRLQHRNQPGPEAHPNGGFMVPNWNGSVAASGAAYLGQAPSWAL
jgi:hypothetical protein